MRPKKYCPKFQSWTRTNKEELNDVCIDRERREIKPCDCCVDRKNDEPQKITNNGKNTKIL